MTEINPILIESASLLSLFNARHAGSSACHPFLPASSFPRAVGRVVDLSDLHRAHVSLAGAAFDVYHVRLKDDYVWIPRRSGTRWRG